MIQASNLPALAVDIFAAIKAARPNTVFLCDGAEDTVVVFNGIATHQFHYRASLYADGGLVKISSDDRHPVSIFLDKKKNGTVRFVIFSPKERNDFSGVLEFDSSDDTKNELIGHIVITAHEEGGDGQVVIHAVFGGGGEASVLIDSAPKLIQHLNIDTDAWTKMVEGGGTLVELLPSAGITDLEG